MFNSLSGTVAGRAADRIFLRTGGIEWEIWTGDRVAEALSLQHGPVRIYTYLHHRDDQLKIYGFDSEQGRELFLDLIKVEGVGPKLAIKIMSGMNAEEFISAVQSENVEILQSLPGLGRKTAQKIILSLQGKIASVSTADQHGDIVDALVGMGFDKKEAQQAVLAAWKHMEGKNLDEEEEERELLRLAIREMGQKR